MGGRSHVITFGVFPFKNGTLYYAVAGTNLLKENLTLFVFL